MNWDRNAHEPLPLFSPVTHLLSWCDGSGYAPPVSFRHTLLVHAEHVLWPMSVLWCVMLFNPSRPSAT